MCKIVCISFEKPINHTQNINLLAEGALIATVWNIIEAELGKNTHHVLV